MYLRDEGHAFTKGDFKMTNLNILPTAVQNDIKGTLKAYDKVNVTFEDGRYSVMTGACLKSSYAKDYEVIGTYHKDDVFTKEEQQCNYIEQFHDYHISYKGSKNWDMIKKLRELRGELKQGLVKMDNGNAVIYDVEDIIL